MKLSGRIEPANTLNGVIIVGSARSDGNTSKVAELLAAETGMALIDLNDWNIGHFSYDLSDRDDDFMPLMHRILEFDLLVMATPVYWYSMSSVMKTFFDRFSDLIKWHKDTGRRLRGKSMALLSCSESDDRDDFFTMPFSRSAAYLGMEYVGDTHIWLSRGEVSDTARKGVSDFTARLMSEAVREMTS